jgi:probable F420-dependent oxidoreductase
VHLGVILPNFGDDATPGRIRRTTEVAEELGFDSVWTTEHLLVGAEGVDRFGRVYDALMTLAWIAGWTERVRLGTSIVIVPLHHPVHLAKEVATLQELSRGRAILGTGVGWHRAEFEFLGVEFDGRDRRTDEAVRLIRALWSGERGFEGRWWSFADASFAPLPTPVPEIWVGGSSRAAIRRAVRLGDVWHPSRGSGADEVRRVKGEHPDLRVIPRTAPQLFEPMLEAGAEGAVLTFPDEQAMRDFARRYR